jgi:two-component system, OmpR family, KDP operon response regulator KdpE
MNETETILIIDDELQIRRLLEITLSANGYKILQAGNGKDGLVDAATRANASKKILDLIA